MTRYLALLPEAALALTGLAIFVALLGRDQRRDARAKLAAQLGGLLVLAACLASQDRSLEVFWVSYRVDAFSQLVKAVLAVGFLLATVVVDRGAGQREDARGEIFFFLLSSTAGLVMMTSAVEALSLYLALEIASFSLFVIVPLREGFPAGKEAGLKFLLVGLGSSV